MLAEKLGKKTASKRLIQSVKRADTYPLLRTRDNPKRVRRWFHSYPYGNQSSEGGKSQAKTRPAAGKGEFFALSPTFQNPRKEKIFSPRRASPGPTSCQSEGRLYPGSPTETRKSQTAISKTLRGNADQPRGNLKKERCAPGRPCLTQVPPKERDQFGPSVLYRVRTAPES